MAQNYVRVGAGQYRAVGKDGKPAGPVIKSTTNPASKSATPSGKTTKPKDPTPTNPATLPVPKTPTPGDPNPINIPNTSGVSSNVRDLLPDAEFFADLFTGNMTPRTIDTSGIDNTVGTAEDMLKQAWVPDPFVDSSLGALQQTYNQAGGSVGQEDALLNYITQGALRGFSPEQIQVARESGQSQIDRAMQGLMRGAQGQGANLGIFGSDVLSSAYPGMRLGMDALANLERDLFLGNIQRQDALAGQGLEFGNEIRRRRFGEMMDSSGNLFQGALTNREANRADQLNRFENLANLRNAQATYQGMNNDSLNAFELSKLGAFTGGMSMGDSLKTNQRVLDLQKNALNLGNNRRSVTSPAFATGAREWNQSAGPTNNSSMAGSQFS